MQLLSIYSDKLQNSYIWQISILKNSPSSIEECQVTFRQSAKTIQEIKCSQSANFQKKFKWSSIAKKMNNISNKFPA